MYDDIVQLHPSTSSSTLWCCTWLILYEYWWADQAPGISSIWGWVADVSPMYPNYMLPCFCSISRTTSLLSSEKFSRYNASSSSPLNCTFASVLLHIFFCSYEVLTARISSRLRIVWKTGTSPVINELIIIRFGSLRWVLMKLSMRSLKSLSASILKPSLQIPIFGVYIKPDDGFTSIVPDLLAAQGYPCLGLGLKDYRLK